MRFEQLYSSSSGNLYVVTASNGKRLLIECGVTWADLKKALDYDLSDIVGCLVSHEHMDHSKAVADVIKAGIDVYASWGTIEALGVKDSRKAHVLTTFPAGPYAATSPEEIDCFEVCQWPSDHDAEQP